MYSVCYVRRDKHDVCVCWRCLYACVDACTLSIRFRTLMVIVLRLITRAASHTENSKKSGKLETTRCRSYIRTHCGRRYAVKTQWHRPSHTVAMRLSNFRRRKIKTPRNNYFPWFSDCSLARAACVTVAEMCNGRTSSSWLILCLVCFLCLLKIRFASLSDTSQYGLRIPPLGNNFECTSRNGPGRYLHTRTHTVKSDDQFSYNFLFSATRRWCVLTATTVMMAGSPSVDCHSMSHNMH